MLAVVPEPVPDKEPVTLRRVDWRLLVCNELLVGQVRELDLVVEPELAHLSVVVEIVGVGESRHRFSMSIPAEIGLNAPNEI